ncbi:glycosyl transferase family protein [Candidatus Magnetoovum chiemensis]|nr:glycosyl transferase family protein [Candidatus Magnetoovum chiemensis]
MDNKDRSFKKRKARDIQGKTLSIIIPMYNEASNIERLFEELLPVINKTGMDYEIICVNDGSSDNTLESLINYRNRYEQIKIIDLSRNFGKEIALTAGINLSSGDAVVPIDADLQDPPHIIEDLIIGWKNGYDVVYAVREKRYGEPWLKKITANLFYRIYNYISSIPIPQNTGDFRLLDRKVVDVLNRLPESNRFMKGLFAWTGFNQTGVYFDRQARFSGKTKWNYIKLWNLAIEGLVQFSIRPLKVWSYIGFIISFISFLYGSYLVFRTMIFGADVPGYASLMVGILFMGGLQLIGIGILGEYLGRVYLEVKGRPLYVISDLYGFNNKNNEGKDK